MAIDLTKYKLIFFDVDNTLIDTYGDMRRIIIRTLENSGSPVTEEIIAGFYDCNARWWSRYNNGEFGADLAPVKLGRFTDFVSEFGLPGDPALMAVDYVELLRTSATLFPGTEELLRRLSETHVLAITSNSEEAQQRRRLEAAGIAKYFTHWIVADTHGYVKPDPCFFLEGMKRAGIRDRSQVLVVGDHPIADLQGSADAGMDNCFVYANVKTEPAARVTYRVKYPSELLDIKAE